MFVSAVVAFVVPQEVQVVLHKLSEDIMFEEERAESGARIERLRKYVAMVSRKRAEL